MCDEDCRIGFAHNPSGLVPYLVGPKCFRQGSIASSFSIIPQRNGQARRSKFEAKVGLLL